MERSLRPPRRPLKSGIVALLLVRTALVVLVALVALVTAAVGGVGRASAAPTAASAGERDRAWPVAPGPGPGPGSAARPPVVHGWEPPSSPWGAGHRGVDLGTATGREVRAAAPGVVSFAGAVAGRGVVSVELDASGQPPLRTTYEPVRASVREGERVQAGQVVGTVQDGPFHCPSACLHWGLLRGERYLDPLSLLPGWMLRAGPVRLLPLSGAPRPSGEAPVGAAAEAAGKRGTAGAGAAAGALLLAAGAAWGRRRLGRAERATRPGGPNAGSPRAGPSPPRPR